MTRTNGLEDARKMLRLMMGFIPARALYVVAKLGIADRLANGPLSAAELGAVCGCDPGALYRTLRLVSETGAVKENAGKFALTPLGETLCAASNHSVRDYVILYHELTYRSFLCLVDSVRNGKPALESVFGAPLFDYFETNPTARKAFLAGLRSQSRLDNAVILQTYDFSNFARVADIGGGSGVTLEAITSYYPNIEGVLFDTAETIALARNLAEAPLSHCEFVAGDFFASIPITADLFILKQVLHDWSDDDAIRVLKNCRAAMAGSGKLLIIERLICVAGDSTLTNYMDLVMLNTALGKERTEHEYKKLLERSGFQLSRVLPTELEIGLMEATPT